MMKNIDNDDNELDDLFSFGTSPRNSSKEGVVVLKNDTNAGMFDDHSGATTPSNTENLGDYNDRIDENHEEQQANHRASNDQPDLFGAAGHDAGSRDFLEWLDAGDVADHNDMSIAAEAGTEEEDISDGSSVVAGAKEHQNILTKDDSFDFEADIWGANNNTKEAEVSASHLDGNNSSVVHLDIDSTNISNGNDVNAANLITVETSENGDGDERSANSNSDNATTASPQKTTTETTSIASPTSLSSLQEALFSPKSTAAQLRHFMNNKEEHQKISSENRKHLYIKLLCNNKTFDEVKDSSLAFSYVEWSSSSLQQRGGRFHEQATMLSQELYPCDDDDDRRQLFYSDLTSLLTFYHLRNNNSNLSEEENESSSRFLPTIAALLLHILESASVTSVVLQSFLHVLVPILPLTSKEQVDAAQHLAKYWYLLCLFHIPVVVMHLDRYLPGWHCPKVNIISSTDIDDDIIGNRRYKNLDTKGVVPLSWFIACFAGSPYKMDNSDTRCCSWEGGFPLQCLIHLWDMVLLQPEGRLMSSLKFFLALRILEQRAHDIMQIRGSDLLQDFLENQVFSYFSAVNHGTTIEDGDNTSTTDTNDDEGRRRLVYNFTSKALALQESTPVSFLSQLSTLDDTVVRSTLRERQRLTLSAIKDQLDEEARSYVKREEGRKKEQEVRMNREIREKLRVYYETNNPEKVSDSSLDLILKVYNGRIDELNDRLAGKYGARFLTTAQVQKIVSEHQRRLDSYDDPSKSPRQVKDQYPETSKLMRLVHHPNSLKKKKVTPAATENQSLAEIDEMLINNYFESSSEQKQNNSAVVQIHRHQVALQISPSEVLPHVCASKSDSSSPLRRNSNSQMKFFLIDSRPMILAKAQGRFPTAVNLPPETLFDPDLIQKEVERFESFRGSVHLVIMGEGISAIPSLYSHALTVEEQKLAQEDYSRTELCALFFIKRGFPYVSILEGGFSAAYSFLYREKIFQLSQVLVDYEENVSIWSKLEKANENPVGEISKQMTALIGEGVKRISRTSATFERVSSENLIVENVHRVKPTNPRPPLPSKNHLTGLSPKFVLKNAGADGGVNSAGTILGTTEDSTFSLSANVKSLSGTGTVERPMSPWSSLNLRSKAPTSMLWKLSEPTTNSIATPSEKNNPLFPFQQNLFAIRKVTASTSTATIEPEKASSGESRQPFFLSRFGLGTSIKQNSTSKGDDVNAHAPTFASPEQSRVSKNLFPSNENDSSEETVILFDIGDLSDDEEQSLVESVFPTQN